MRHLSVNRVEICDSECGVCGRTFTSDPAGEQILFVTLVVQARRYYFCGACGENILGHVASEESRKRYEWDWAVPLKERIRQTAAIEIERPFDSDSLKAKRRPVKRPAKARSAAPATKSQPRAIDTASPLEIALGAMPAPRRRSVPGASSGAARRGSVSDDQTE